MTLWSLRFLPTLNCGERLSQKSFKRDLPLQEEGYTPAMSVATQVHSRACLERASKQHGLGCARPCVLALPPAASVRPISSQSRWSLLHRDSGDSQSSSGTDSSISSDWKAFQSLVATLPSECSAGHHLIPLEPQPLHLCNRKEMISELRKVSRLM